MADQGGERGNKVVVDDGGTPVCVAREEKNALGGLDAHGDIRVFEQLAQAGNDACRVSVQQKILSLGMAGCGEMSFNSINQSINKLI